MKSACFCRLCAVLCSLDAYPARHETANETDLKLKSCIENLKGKPTIANNKEQLISCFCSNRQMAVLFNIESNLDGKLCKESS